MTELLDGVFLGICVNHTIVDGVSHFHFQRVWSNIFMGLFSSSVSLPLMKKPAFLDGRIVKLLYLYPNNELVTRSTNTTEGELIKRLFKFSANSLNNIKAMANSEAMTNKAITTFEALIALVWKCITRARNLFSDELTTIALPINLRPRFNPPLTENQFGNYSYKVKGSAKVDDLLNNSIGWAAMLLQQVVVAQDDCAARAFVERAFDKGLELAPPTQTHRSRDVNVAGSTRFDVNESQFGLGKLAGFRTGFANKEDGKVNAYLGSDCDGSVELDVCLVPQTMSALLSDHQFMSFTSPHKPHFNLISKV